MQTANHAVAGLEFDLTERMNVNIEGYVKHFTRLTNINRNKLFPDNITYASEEDAFKKDFIVETGRAVGADVVLKYEERETYLWFVYGLGNVDRWDGFRWYDPLFDRRHNVNLVASQGFGKQWLVSARWNWVPDCHSPKAKGITRLLVRAAESTGTMWRPTRATSASSLWLNEGRLPAYHRLDVNMKRTWGNADGSQLELSVGITNVYSRQNVFYINRITGQRKDQLPFLPSVGLDWTF